MRIQNKLFTIFFLTSVVLVTAQVLIMQWSIGKGMIDYVNQKELEALDSLVVKLEDIYQENNSWQSLTGRHHFFKTIIGEYMHGKTPNSLESSPEERQTGPLGEERAPRGELSREGAPRGGPPRGGPSREGAPRGGPARGEMASSESESEFADEPPPKYEDGAQPSVIYAVLDVDKAFLVGIYPDNSTFEYTDIIVAEEVVGFLAISKSNKLTEGYELNFVEQQQRYVLFIAIGLIVIAILVALPLAKHFVTPIKQLAKAMSQLTSGQYEQRINLKRKDEFAQLSRDFNELAATLEQNEQARKRWLADISHELRTPVAVLKGELESMLDGVRPLSMERIQSSNEEVKQLEQLLNDLHELTRSDLGTMHYRKTWIQLDKLLEEETNHFHTVLSEKGICVEYFSQTDNIKVYADATRLKQLFSNLLSNVGKYAIDGDVLKVTIHLVDKPSQKEAHICFEDNGQGVNEEDLERLFEHLFRVENSRNRETGGSGLGLSICKKIVEAHHGKISAFSSELGGLGIKIILPVE